jgi:hypothetical protein
MQALETVTASGKFYYLKGRPVSRLAMIEAKSGKTLSCFVTRVTPRAVRNWFTIEEDRSSRVAALVERNRSNPALLALRRACTPTASNPAIVGIPSV